MNATITMPSISDVLNTMKEQTQAAKKDLHPVNEELIKKHNSPRLNADSKKKFTTTDDFKESSQQIQNRIEQLFNAHNKAANELVKILKNDATKKPEKPTDAAHLTKIWEGVFNQEPYKIEELTENGKTNIKLYTNNSPTYASLSHREPQELPVLEIVTSQKEKSIYTDVLSTEAIQEKNLILEFMRDPAPSIFNTCVGQNSETNHYWLL